VVWDPETNKPLCRFGRDGRFVCSDPTTVNKLIRRGIPYEDSRANDLANAEYAIEVLTERLNILEEINNSLKDRLERHEAEVKNVRVNDREALISELDYLGVPYLFSSSDTTLRYILEEYKSLMRLKSRKQMGEFDDIELDEDDDED